MKSSFAAIEAAILHDPGQRGCAPLLVPGDLEAAARSLRSATAALIVTGFFVPAPVKEVGCYLPDAGACETDGPLGAWDLATCLEAIGIEAAIATDAYSLATLQGAGIDALRLSGRKMVDPRFSHFVSIERLGRTAAGDYCNMAGLVMEFNAPLDELFLEAAEAGRKTISIGDGGNEIGMGKVHDLVRQHVPLGEQIASTVATDQLIVAGTSNWGAWGLIAALSLLEGKNLLPTDDRVVERLEKLVKAGAVDGRTKRNEATVDGFGVAEYLAPLAELREIVDQTGRGIEAR